MPSIRPVSDLRNHFAEITKEVQADNEPVFLTKNGVGSIVVMSMEAYEARRYDSEVYDRLREARKMIEDSGCSVDLEVDGGVKESNFDAILEAGANVIVAGTAVFRGNIEKNASFFTKKLAIFSNKL